MNYTVQLTKDMGLCCSCGICKSVCPKSCITYQRKDGMYYPVIDTQKCIECGLCFDICPGMKHDYSETDAIKAMTGNCICAYNAWSKDNTIRHVSASGGCVSSLVVELLRSNEYDYAVTLDTYNYREQLKSVLISADDLQKEYADTSYPKSRYLPVSHEDIIDFVLHNKTKRIVFIGTSCAVRGFLNAVKKFHLNRENYLVIGLFCDKVFNYNIYNYYTFIAKNDDKKELTNLHFKNKESGGWPGNMKWFFSDGSYKYVDESERMKLKAFFMPERCLYCIDKLNVEADISIGDNFTDVASSKKGSNSVIIRTHIGLKAWKKADEAIISEIVDVSKIIKVQNLIGRSSNAYFAMTKQRNCDLEKDLNNGIVLSPQDVSANKAYDDSLQKLALGKDFLSNPEKSIRKINRIRKKESRTSLKSRLVYYYKKLLIH